MSAEATAPVREAQFAYWVEIPTRWADCDSYGHVNNAQYYSFFDTAVTRWLITHATLEPQTGEVIGLCVQSHCDFHAPIAFPETVTAGVRIGHLGRSSVRYELALYGQGQDRPVATGQFTHVYVDRHTRRPVAIPPAMREAMGALVTGTVASEEGQLKP